MEVNTEIKVETERKKPFDLHVVGRILFALYLAALVYMMFFAESLGRDSVYEEWHYNLQLFREIRRCIEYRELLGPWTAFANLVGNVAAFVPLGMFLPYVWKPGKRMLLTIGVGLLVSLVIEVLQLVSRRGSFDVDDLLLNTLGVVLGCLIYRFLRSMDRRREIRQEK